MPYKTEDKEYYLRAAAIFKLLRYVTFLLLVILIIFSISFYHEDITIQNFQYLMKYIDINPPETAAGKTQINFSGEENPSFALMRGDLAVISNRNFSLYDFSGGKQFNYDLKYSNPTVVSSNKYSLVYDINGKSLSLFNSFSRVLEKQYDYEIEGACISGDSFAVINTEKGYLSGVRVYNSKFKEAFKFMSRDKRITDISLSGNAERLACVSVGVSDGDFLSVLSFFNVKSGEKLFDKELPGELPLSLYCTDKGIILLTDTSLTFFDESGNQKNKITFGTETPYSCYIEKDFFALIQKSSLTGSNMHLVLYDCNGKECFTEKYTNEIMDISSYDGRFYVLEQSNLWIYDYKPEELSFTKNSSSPVTVSGDSKRVFASDKNEYILVSDIGAAKYIVN